LGGVNVYLERNHRFFGQSSVQLPPEVLGVQETLGQGVVRTSAHKGLGLEDRQELSSLSEGDYDVLSTFGVHLLATEGSGEG